MGSSFAESGNCCGISCISSLVSLVPTDSLLFDAAIADAVASTMSESRLLALWNWALKRLMLLMQLLVGGFSLDKNKFVTRREIITCKMKDMVLIRITIIWM